MQCRSRVGLGHGGNVGRCAIPSADAVDWWNHSQSGHPARTSSQKVIAGGIAGCRRVSGQVEAVCEIRLKKAFYPVQVLENQLVAGVELDTGFAVDALGVELGAKPALGTGAVAARFPRPADFALYGGQFKMGI